MLAIALRRVAHGVSSAKPALLAVTRRVAPVGRVVVLTRGFAAALPAHVATTMPALSPTMEAGTIAEWCIKEGQAFNAGDVMAKIETDKATVDFEAVDGGFLGKIIVSKGEVKVGKVIAIMADTQEGATAMQAMSVDDVLAGLGGAGGGAKAAAAPVAAAAAPVAAAAASSAAAAAAPAAATTGRVIASPYAKKLASETGVNLASVGGTGPNGRIIAADVTEAAARLAAAPAPAPPATAASAAASAPAAADARSGYVDVPLTGMRRVIAKRLVASKQTVPHYYLTSEVCLDALLAMRVTLNGCLTPEAKLSVNDFIIKASALACKKVPEVNSSWLGDVIRAYDYVDVCVAVSTPEGLITPIVRDAHTKGLASIASDVKALAGKARAKKLLPEEYQGGTFTVSNLGMFGVRQFAAIINPPQAAILAVGTAEKRIVPELAPGAASPYKAATMMNVTLSADHRVVDGAVGAQWLASFKGFIEAPSTMLL